MQARIGGRTFYIVLLKASGKLTPVGDSNRVRKWLESGLRKQQRMQMSLTAGSG